MIFDYKKDRLGICRGGLFLYKDLFRKGFTQGLADADDDEGNAEEEEADEGVDGPEVEFRRMEGHLQKYFDHDDESARENGRAAENEEIASSDITGECDDRGHDERSGNGNGKHEGEKPFSVREFVDKPEVKRHRREITRHEDDGIRSCEPRRQKDHDIGQRKSADRIQRPTQLIENGYLADDELDREHNVKHGDEEENSASVDARMRSSVRGIIGRDLLLRKLGMEYRRSAEGTAFFSVGKLDTAFDTKHSRFLSVVFLFQRLGLFLGRGSMLDRLLSTLALIPNPRRTL